MVSQLAVAASCLVPAAAPAQGDCSNPPSTMDLRVLAAAQSASVTLRAPSTRYPGCDEPADPITATVDWGDGATSTAAIEPAGDGRITVVAQHSYDRPGVYPVTVTQRNERTGVTRKDTHYQAWVNPTGTVRERRALTWRAGRRFAGVVAGFPSVGVLNPERFVARVAWGDGTSSRGTVVAGGAGLAVAGRHTWRRRPEGRDVTVTVVERASGAILRVKRSLRIRR